MEQCDYVCEKAIHCNVKKSNLMLELTGTKYFQTLIHCSHTLKESLLFPPHIF